MIISENFMRLILFFDLPSETKEDRKQYRIFVKNLIKLGYIRMQNSVLTKIVNVQTKVEREHDKIIKILPKYGDIRIMSVTENQYQKTKILLGAKTLNEEINEKQHIII
jgi:CRISPR-associated protein Cas2